MSPLAIKANVGQCEVSISQNMPFNERKTRADRPNANPNQHQH